MSQSTVNTVEVQFASQVRAGKTFDQVMLTLGERSDEECKYCWDEMMQRESLELAEGLRLLAANGYTTERILGDLTEWQKTAITHPAIAEFYALAVEHAVRQYYFLH